MSKKLLSVVLAVALVLSTFAVAAFAIGGYGYENDEDAAAYTQAWSLGQPVANGNTYTVDVILNANYGVGPIQFKVIKNVTAGTLTLTDAAYNEAVIPENWLADISFSDETGEVAIIPAPDEDAVSGADVAGGKVIATLTYTASADVEATLKLDVADAKSASNPGGTLIAARMSDGNVVTGTALVGQTVSATTNTVAIGGAVVATPPELAVIDGAMGVIYTEQTELDANEGTSCDGYIFGWDSAGGHTVDEIFEVIGDGTMEIVPNVEGNECASGTMVQVLDLDGAVVAEYVVIIFGDVNGDGFADSNDASNIELHENLELGDTGELPTYLQFAGDVNLDGFADSNDASNIELHENLELGDTGELDIESFIEYYQG